MLSVGTEMLVSIMHYNIFVTEVLINLFIANTGGALGPHLEALPTFSSGQYYLFGISEDYCPGTNKV